MKRLCVFCGSSDGAREVYGEATRSLAEVLARRGVGLVYGGGRVGLMGRLADAVLERGGEVIGVIPESLVEREVAHEGLSVLRVVRTMHERKAQMAAYADAFAALPGGLGTLEELFEVWTWGQLGLHRKPIGLLDAEGFFGPLLSALRHADREGFIRGGDLDGLVVAKDPEALLDGLEAGLAPPP